MGKPEWRPENAYDDQNPEMYYAFDEGAQAMAKALIREIERRHGLMLGDGTISIQISSGRWATLRREVLGE